MATPPARGDCFTPNHENKMEKIRITIANNGLDSACEQCGLPFSTGDDAYLIVDYGPIVCSKTCAANLTVDWEPEEIGDDDDDGYIDFLRMEDNIHEDHR
jgi:hypothetical protein